MIIDIGWRLMVAVMFAAICVSACIASRGSK